MSANQKNLLEAFRTAGGTPKPPDAKPPADKGPTREPPRPPRPPAPAGGGAWRAPRWLPMAAALGIAFVLGVLLGRGARGVSKAAPGGAEPAPGAPPETAPAEVGRGAAVPQAPAADAHTESALLDPANQYTVIAATYGRTRSDFAWATHDQMKDLGLPVFTPWQRERDILVLVGAAATKEGLREVEARLRRLDGWDGAKDAYADAYIDRIDKLIVREAR